MELLSKKDFRNLVSSLSAMDFEDMDDLWTAWGIDSEAVAEAAFYTSANIGNEMNVHHNPETHKVLMACVVMGVVLGCQAAIEVETRRQADERT